MEIEIPCISVTHALIQSLTVISQCTSDCSGRLQLKMPDSCEQGLPVSTGSNLRLFSLAALLSIDLVPEMDPIPTNRKTGHFPANEAAQMAFPAVADRGMAVSNILGPVPWATLSHCTAASPGRPIQCYTFSRHLHLWPQ